MVHRRIIILFIGFVVFLWAQYSNEWTSSNLGQYGWGGAYGYDIDNDGLVEYYVRQAGQLTFYNGDYSVEWSISVPGFDYVSITSPRDIDGNGLSIPLNTDNDAAGEIIITAYYYNTGNNTYYGKFRIYDAATRIMEYESPQITGFYGSATQEDIDGDGRDEIILTRFGSSANTSYVDVYAYTGTGINENTSYALKERIIVNPNPATSSTSIMFSITPDECNDPVRVSVHDVSGRCIRVLFFTAQAIPGTYEFIWDGMDESGMDVPSGTYLITVRTEHKNQCKQIQIVR